MSGVFVVKMGRNIVMCYVNNVKVTLKLLAFLMFYSESIDCEVMIHRQLRLLNLKITILLNLVVFVD